MPTVPKCMKCEKPATHKITKIVKGKVFDIFLCDEHAQTFSPYLKKVSHANLVELLQQFIKQQDDVPQEETESQDKGPTCSNCGLEFDGYRKTFLLGCSECYRAFEDLLVNDLRKIHGVICQDPAQAEKYEARARDKDLVVPNEMAAKPKPAPKVDTLSSLKEEMQEAIEREDFERAAELRDLIRVMDAPGMPPGEGKAASQT